MNKFLIAIKKSFRNFGLRVSIQDKILFSRHLAVMAKAGLPLLESLRMIQQETKSRSMLKILKQVISDVSNGQFLSASLERYKDLFGDLFVNIIRVGESAGILAENLNYLADELKKKKELRSRVVSALIYPAIIFIATLGITIMLMVFIFPKIIPVFQNLNAKLPATTQFLINFSSFLTNKGIMLLIGLVVLFVIWSLLLKVNKIKYFYHKILLFLPIFGGVSRDLNLANFTRTLGLTLKSGIRVVEALNITAQSLSSLVYKKELMQIAEEVTKGGAVSPYLTKRQRLFPSMVSQMVAVGETSGNLSETLLYLSDFYDSEVTETTKNLASTLEPLIMVVMGAMVGFIAIAIITPIYEITQNI